MKRLLLLVNVLVFIGVTSVVAFHIIVDRENVLADAVSDAANLRDALVEQSRQTFAAVDLALAGVADSIDPRALGRAETHQGLRIRQDIFAPTFAIFIVDEDGRLAATSRTPTPEPVDLSGERMFTAHRGDPSLGLFIEPPRKGRVGYAEDRWIVTVGRRLNHADGTFAGIVAAALSIDYLTGFYDALRTGNDGAVGLMKDDGSVIARSPFDETYLRRALTDTKLFGEMLPSADSGVYRARFVTDGVDRVTAYGRVPGFPVVVYVGVSATERLAGWRGRAVVEGGLGLLTMLAIAGLSIFFARRTPADAHDAVRAGGPP